LNCGLGNHGRGGEDCEGTVTFFFLDEDPNTSVVFLSGNEGTAAPNPYEEASLAKEDSQSLTGADGGLDDDDKLTVKVLLDDLLDESMLSEVVGRNVTRETSWLVYLFEKREGYFALLGTLLYGHKACPNDSRLCEVAVVKQIVTQLLTVLKITVLSLAI